MRRLFNKRDRHIKIDLQLKGTKLEVLFCSAMHIALVHIATRGDDWEDDCRSLFNNWSEEGWTVITDAPVSEEAE